VDASTLRAAKLLPPLSKSDAQRALVLEHVLGRPGWMGLSAEDAAELPADVRALTRGLRTLEAPAQGPVEIDCADGGAPFRFLLGQAAVTPGAHVFFRGTPRLGERPHGALIEALRAALGPSGLSIVEGTPWPLEVRAPSRTGEPVFRVAGAESSQFVSSLLLAAAALNRREGRAWTVELDGPVASEGYLDLTLDWLARTGFAVERRANALAVTGWTEPERPPAVPGDWSSLGYLLVVAWKSGGTALRADLDAAHPDRAIVRILRDVGLTVEPVGAAGEVAVRGVPRSGLTASGAECPDLLPTLAVLACVLPGESRLDEVDILRGKESDRFQGILDLTKAAGAQAVRDGGSLRIRPGPRVASVFELDSRGDHRMAMCAATLAVLGGSRLVLTGPECVSKSFPGFWRQMEAAGVRAREAGSPL